MNEADPVCSKSDFHHVVTDKVTESLNSFGTEVIYRNKKNSLALMK